MNSLEDEVVATQASLRAFAETKIVQTRNRLGAHDSGDSSFLKPSITIVGHSVGAYIALTLLERYDREFQHKTPCGSTEESSLPYRLSGIVLLFPTVIDISASPNGQKLGWLFQIPGLDSLVGAFARGSLKLAGGAFAKRVVSYAMTSGMSNYLERLDHDTRREKKQEMDEAVATTVSWLGSNLGVRQAL